MKVKLTYFKPSGKHYASGEYDTAVPVVELVWPPNASAPPLYQIFEEVSGLKAQRRLPGLHEGHSDFTVLIDVPDHPHRHLHLIPEPLEPDVAADDAVALKLALSLARSHAIKAADTMASGIANRAVAVLERILTSNGFKP